MIRAERRPCKACGAPLVFVKSEKGITQVLDVRSPTWTIQEDLTGAEIAVRSTALVSHFCTCPSANAFSKGRKK